MSMIMKTLEELDAEIVALKEKERPLWEAHKKADEDYHRTLNEWNAVYRERQELQQKRGVLAELLESYRGNEKLAV